MFAKIVLVVTASLLILAGAYFGIDPEESVGPALGVSQFSTDGLNIFRSELGIRWAFAIFFVLGALMRPLERPALLALIVYMSGAALGRTASLAMDGVPETPVLATAVLREFVLAALGFYALRRRTPSVDRS